MQERQVTIGDTTYLGTAVSRHGDSKPNRSGGHYPLPEAVDRFMMLVKVDYPSREGREIVPDSSTQARRPFGRSSPQTESRRLGVQSAISTLTKAKKIHLGHYLCDS